MDVLKRRLLGSSTPSRAHYRLFLLKMVMWLLVVISFAEDFVAARWFAWGGVLLAGYLGVTHAGLLFPIRTGGQIPASTMEELPGFFRWVRAAGVSMILWIAIVRGAGGLVTFFCGHYAVWPPVELHYYTTYLPNTGTCYQQWRGPALKQFQQGGICMDSKSSYLYNRRHVQAQLRGIESPFGFYIQGLTVLKDLGPYNP